MEENVRCSRVGQVWLVFGHVEVIVGAPKGHRDEMWMHTTVNLETLKKNFVFEKSDRPLEEQYERVA